MTKTASDYLLLQDTGPDLGENRPSLQFDEGQQDGWNRAIQLLHTWWTDPSQIAERDAGQVPSKQILLSAIRTGEAMRDEGRLSPLRVVPTMTGGICFERWDGDRFEVIEIRSDGSKELRSFSGNRLQAQRPLRTAVARSA